MIVSCRSCQTRFRIADEKVKERGVKVRCSRCGEVFPVRRDDEPLAGPGSDPAWGGGPPPRAPRLPSGDELSVHEGPTRVGSVSPGLLDLASAPELAPPARPLAPPASPPPPSPSLDPFAELDPFGDAPAPAFAPAVAPPPPPAPRLEDPFEGLDLEAPPPPRSLPPPLPTRPRADALSPPAPPLPDDDPFAGLDTPEPQRAADPLGLGDLDDAPPLARSLDVDVDAPSDPARESRGPPRPSSSSGRRAVARISSPEPRVSLRPPPPPRPAPRSSPSLSVAAGVVLLLGALLGVVALRTGGLSAQALSVDGFLAALGLDVAGSAERRELVPRDVVTALYPTASGRSVLVVRGRIESAAAAVAGPAVRVQAELMSDGASVIGRAGTWAGRAPGLDEIHALRGGADWEALVRRLGEDARPLAPRASAPFVAVFVDPPERLDRARVRITAERAAPAAPGPTPPVATPIAAEPAAR